MASMNEGERWTLNVCKDCGKYMREHPSYCDKTGRRHVGATNVWPVKVVPAEALREAERRLADVRLSMTTLRREHAHAWEEVDRVTHLRDLGAKVIVDTEEALREAKAAHEKADAENRMLRAFIDRGEYQEDVTALFTVNRCSYCGDLVGSDPTLCGPCGGESDMERDEALEAAREAGAEVARLREALKAIKRVAYIEAPPVSDEVPAKVWKIASDALVESELKTGGRE